MASSDVLSQVLHSITSTKLEEVSKQQSAFEASKANLLAGLEKESDQVERIRTLLDAKEGTSSPSTSNIRRFLQQARHDPSVSARIKNQWETDLRHGLDVRSVRYEYASLFGKLVTEWLATSGADGENGSEDEESFEKVGREEMHKQRATWEAYVFNALQTDKEAINTYLNGLFTSSKATEKAVATIRESTKAFESRSATSVAFDDDSLKWTIDGLLASDLLSDAKRSALEDFRNNKLVLKELADILNMRLSALESWSWDSKGQGTPVEQRRQINGRYRFYHDEDLLQTIFLRYIGVVWSVHFKEIFTNFAKSEGVWKSAAAFPSKVEIKRREDCGLGQPRFENSVEGQRKKFWEEDVFLEQLQSEEDEGNRAYDDDDSDHPSSGPTRKTPQDTVQSVLRMLITDILIKTHLDESVTVVRSDFKWFGPSLPHSTIFAVLRFFGVSDRWIKFFRAALEAPMKFIADGPDAPVQIRKRGTPISGPLSDMMGESVLFCLDFAFNQRTQGARLWRLHDDIWFWGSQQTCEVGWSCMTEFTALTGLEFNTEKTGSAHVAVAGQSSTPPSLGLPTGDVRWGFLKLDAATGRFLIDQAMVDTHISELRRQLAACKSVFDWIQAWNIYACRFFSTNFGRPAICFGLEHVDEILSTFERIQRTLFNDNEGGVSSILKDMIKKRFGVDDVPEGYLYFPTSVGGLDVKSPFIVPYLVRANLEISPATRLCEFFEREAADYERAKSSYESSLETSRKRVSGNPSRWGSDIKTAPFLNFDEFVKDRESVSTDLGRVFAALLEEPGEAGLGGEAVVKGWVERRKWEKMRPYERWIMLLYAQDVVAKFGAVEVVDQGMLPTGILSLLKRSRFQWVG
jgi:hypothetical protein